MTHPNPSQPPHPPVPRATASLVRRLVNAIDRLKRHPNRWVRRGLGLGLILGGVLWFLPVVGLWMLPLGLVVLSDETRHLRRPRRRLQVWLANRFPQCKVPQV